MSINTFRLSSMEGDVFISPQANTTYKDKIELFGYGYLDWGRVVNQSLVTLMDLIDTMQDSGTSEFTFQLEEYEKTQDVRRTEEFNIWKTEFKKILETMVSEYSHTIEQTVEDFKTEQTDLFVKFEESNSQEITAINDKINEINDGFNKKVSDIVDGLIESTLKTVTTLKTDVTQAISDLKEAKSSMDQATTKLENKLAEFKKEFEDAFEKFKKDTTTALEENKNYIIEYINGKIKNMLTITSNLDTRLSNIELIADTLSPSSLGEAIRAQVNSLANALLNTYLSDFITKMTRLETIVNNLNDNIDNIIDDALALKLKPINTTLTSMATTLESHSKSIADLTIIYTSLKNWQDFFEGKITDAFINKENFWNQLEKMFFNAAESINILGSIEIRNRLKFKTLLEKIIEQNDKNSTNLINGFQEKMLSLINGLSYTEFDERSLIHNFDQFKVIKTEQNTLLNLALNEIDNDKVSVTEFSINPDAKNIKLAFKLPAKFVDTSDKIDVEIARLSATGTNLNKYLQEVYVVNDFTGIPVASAKFFGYPLTNIQTSKMDLVWYSRKYNCSNVIQINDLLTNINDQISIKVTNQENVIIERTFKIKDVYDLDNYTKEIDDNIKTYLYNLDETTSTPINTILTSPTLPTLSYDVTNSKILIPLSKISYRADGSKEFLIKVKLPTGATLTKIEFNDGFSTTTKTFVNHDKFPLSLAEYNTRNLATTENYYKDICSTGALDYSIHADAKKVKGTITYVISGVTKTLDFTSTGSGSNSTVFVEQDIVKGTYTEIDTVTYFGVVDARKVYVDVKVKDTVTGSDTLNMWIDGNNLCSIAVRDNRYIRIYNEYETDLSFYIALTDR